MPGRSPREAHDAFITPVCATFACLTWRPIALDEKPLQVGVTKSLMLGAPSSPVELDGELSNGTTAALFAAMEYSIVENSGVGAKNRYRVSTQKYTYHVTNSLGEEVVLYHWHPDTAFIDPHLHVGKQQLGPNPSIEHDVHIPTARVALESVVLFLIDELGVKPIHPTYKAIIRPILDDFVEHRSWHL